MVKIFKQDSNGTNGKTLNTRETILDAAELIFSHSGYDGASMRQISESAGVAQALLHYHFQSKDGLFSAVFERRSTAASGHRGHLLDELLLKGTKPSLEEILHVLFTPHRVSAAQNDHTLNQYFQLVASLGVGSDERSKELIARYFDPIAQRFIDAFIKAVPGLKTEQAVWSYLFAIGSRMQAQATNDRADRLCTKRGLKAPRPFDLLIPFTAAGIRSLARRK